MSFPRKTFHEGHTYHEEDWAQLQNNIGDYYDEQVLSIISYFTAHQISADPHVNLSIDKVLQGSTFKKLSAAEYADFLKGFYDFYETSTSLTLGSNKDISAYFFGRGADPAGADIHCQDVISRGYPLYPLVFASAWRELAPASGLEASHGLGFSPAFGLLQVAHTDVTGQPEQLTFTDGYASKIAGTHYTSYAYWNNTKYGIISNSEHTRYFRVLLFSYLGG